MLKFFKSIVTLLLIVATMQSCNFLDECDLCVNMPQPLWIKIINIEDSTQNLITTGDYIKDSIKIWYTDGTTAKYLDMNYINYNESINILQCDAPSYCQSEVPKTFYLYLNHTDTDTIVLLMNKESDGCCTAYYLKNITINGIKPKTDSTDYTFLLGKRVSK